MKTKTRIKFPRIPGKTRTTTLTRRTRSRLILNPEGPAQAFRNALTDPDSSRRVHLWKLLGESFTQLFLRPDPRLGADTSDLAFVAKDRTHCTLVDCPLGEPVPSPAQAMLHAAQIGHYMKNRDFPLTTVSLLFVLPEGSKLCEKLSSTFDESYQLPALPLRKSSLSSAKVSGRGTRLGWNSCRYPVSLTYKDTKFDVSLTVRVVSVPSELY